MRLGRLPSLLALVLLAVTCGDGERVPRTSDPHSGPADVTPSELGPSETRPSETRPSEIGPSSAPDRPRADTRARLDVRALPRSIVAELDGMPLSGIVILEPGTYPIHIHVDGALLEVRDLLLRTGETLEIDPAPLLAEASVRREAMARHHREHPGCGAADEPYPAWLVAHRLPDGSWDAARFTERCGEDTSPCDGAVAGVHPAETTALAVLTLLPHGSDHREGAYRVALREGLDWLSRRQTDDGLLGAGSHDAVRVHALATLAFTELTASADSPRHRRVAQRAIDHLLASRRSFGGWARTFEPGVNAPADRVATVWSVLAIESAGRAACELPDGWREALTTDLDVLGDPGAAALSDRDAALVTLAHLVAGRATDHPAVVAGMARVLTGRPDAADPLRLWAATAAAYRWAAHPTGRDAWKRWNEGLRAAGVDRFWTRGEDGAIDPEHLPPIHPSLGRLRSHAWASLVEAVYSRRGRVLGLTAD